MNGQNYANHRYRPTLWLVAALLAVIAFVVDVLFFFRQPRAILADGLMLLALSVVLTIWMVRQYALRLQNRIIRLEMQVRLARLNRTADGDRLSVQQLIALRFASDAEIHSLIDRALAEKLDPNQIKQAVTNWQGDYMRT